MPIHLRVRALVGALCLASVACSEATTEPEPEANPVDVDALFAPATAQEIATVSNEWAGRDVSAHDVVVEGDSLVALDSAALLVRIVSHTVGGYTHYGAIVRDTALTGPAPVVVYAHGGNTGTSVEDLLFQFPYVGSAAKNFVWVVPSFRSESLRFGANSWLSDGPASPWDHDVDDALALLDATFQIDSLADSTSVGVFGFSRGAGVGLLMAVRDPRIDRVVDFFGPTDFLDGFIRDVVEEALAGSPRALPGLDVLDTDFLEPLRVGTLTVAQVRPELVRRSAVLFADRLPAVQIHHGTADLIVEVSQAESLIAAMEALGRGEPDFQAYLYPNGYHNPLTLPGSISRAVDFLLALEPVPLAAEHGFTESPLLSGATGR